MQVNLRCLFYGRFSSTDLRFHFGAIKKLSKFLQRSSIEVFLWTEFSLEETKEILGSLGLDWLKNFHTVLLIMQTVETLMLDYLHVNVS